MCDTYECVGGRRGQKKEGGRKREREEKEGGREGRKEERAGNIVMTEFMEHCDERGHGALR